MPIRIRLEWGNAAPMKGTIKFLFENSLFLVIGAVVALLWANLDHESYEHLVHFELFESSMIGQLPHGEHAEGEAEQAEGEESAEHSEEGEHPMRVVTLHYLVNDILMALFFAMAGKEVWEATLPGGPLSNPRKAATPLIATFGGMAGPAGLYLLGAALLGSMGTLGKGWAIPCATDIAFSYMVARIVFGNGHPAIPFLLLLAIADDALGLIILAVFYPQEEIKLVWMLLAVGAMVLGLIFRRMRIRSFWPYLLVCGPLSWFGFALSGIHPALGLLPIIPVMPHGHVDTGLFDWSQLERHDTLTAFEHWWKNPVELILLAFGLLNAGVEFKGFGAATGLVLVGLIIGKPLGIWVFGIIASKGLRLGLPEGMRSVDLVVLGAAAGIGFTVALFVASVAFSPGQIQDDAKMGALGSFAAAIVALVAGKVCKVEKKTIASSSSGSSGSSAH